jgi:hypothetical protein
MTKVRLADAAPHIIEALERLMAKERSQMPFVVVSDRVTGRFVQFAGSKGERLLFDVPARGVSFRTDETFDAVAALACATMRVNFNLPPQTELLIEEGEQNACPS